MNRESLDIPSVICPECGVPKRDEYRQAGEDAEGFPIFECEICGSSEVEWD